MLTSVVNAPWKLRNEIKRLLVLPFARLLFAVNGIRWMRGWRIYGMPIIQKYRSSSISLGPELALRSARRSNPLAPNHPVVLATRSAAARVVLGTHVRMTGGVICAQEAITIGDRVVIGANCTIVDTDFHPIDAEMRREAPKAASAAPIVIESDVFVGMSAIILKGVRIGRGAVIGAGSVVASDVPPYCVCAGNPARVIRYLGQDETPATQHEDV